MLKHNDNSTIPPMERDSKEPITDRENSANALITRKTRKLSQLVIFSLAFLLTTALIMVGGSFSRITSKGDVSASSLTLMTAGIDGVEVDGTSYTEEDNELFFYNGDDTLIELYSFTITNNSDVDITYDMELNINDISINDTSWSNELEGLIFCLYDDNATWTGIVENNDPPVFKYSTGTDQTVILDREDTTSKTYVLVMDCSDIELMGGDRYDICISGTITFTVNQVAKEGES